MALVLANEMRQIYYYCSVYFTLPRLFLLHCTILDRRRLTNTVLYADAQIYTYYPIVLAASPMAKYTPLSCSVYIFLLLFFPYFPHSFLSFFFWPLLFLYTLFLDRPLVNRLSSPPLGATFLSG